MSRGMENLHTIIECSQQKLDFKKEDLEAKKAELLDVLRGLSRSEQSLAQSQTEVTRLEAQLGQISQMEAQLGQVPHLESQLEAHIGKISSHDWDRSHAWSHSWNHSWTKSHIWSHN
jgi:predicted nuclease with TOPRIM domain